MAHTLKTAIVTGSILRFMGGFKGLQNAGVIAEIERTSIEMRHCKLLLPKEVMAGIYIPIGKQDGRLDSRKAG